MEVCRRHTGEADCELSGGVRCGLPWARRGDNSLAVGDQQRGDLVERVESESVRAGGGEGNRCGRGAVLSGRMLRVSLWGEKGRESLAKVREREGVSECSVAGSPLARFQFPPPSKYITYSLACVTPAALLQGCRSLGSSLPLLLHSSPHWIGRVLMEHLRVVD